MKKVLFMLLVLSLSGCVFVSHERAYPRRGDYYHGNMEVPAGLTFALRRSRDAGEADALKT